MEQRQLPNEPFALLRCRQAYMFLLFSKNWIVVLGLCSRWQCFNNCKFEDPKMSLWLKIESLGEFGNYRVPLGHSNFAGYKYLAPSAGQLRCLWVLLGPWNFGRQKRGGSRQMVPSPEPFVSLLQICWSECPRTSHHPTTNTLIPEMELEVLQQRGNRKLWSEWKDATHSWVPRASTKALWCTQSAPTFAFWFATPLWSSRSHWNCQIVFCPNLNSIAPRVLRWFTALPPTPLKVALGIAGLATHGRNKLVQGASADPTLSFVPFSQSPALDDQLSRFVKLLQQNQALSLFSTETGKTLCKRMFFWEAEHWTKTRLTNVPHQNKVWQANSYLGTCALRPIHL